MSPTTRPGHTAELGFQMMKLGRLNSVSAQGARHTRQSHGAALLRPPTNRRVKASFTQATAAFPGQAPGTGPHPPLLLQAAEEGRSSAKLRMISRHKIYTLGRTNGLRSRWHQRHAVQRDDCP